MIFVDSGAWFASLVPTDPDYAAAQTWFAQNQQPLITTDYVVDETLTLLLVRGQKARALAWGKAIFSGQVARLHYLSPQELHDAWLVFCQFHDKEWSFTDCTCKVVIEQLGIGVACSFDQHFRQFGSMAVVP